MHGAQGTHIISVAPDIYTVLLRQEHQIFPREYFILGACRVPESDHLLGTLDLAVVGAIRDVWIWLH